MLFFLSAAIKTPKLATAAKVASFPDANGDSSRQTQPGTKSTIRRFRHFMKLTTALENFKVGKGITAKLRQFKNLISRRNLAVAP